MRTVAIAAPKGGSGKTSTALLLAVHAAALDLRVALFDMNADQPSLENWLLAREKSRKAQKDLFMPERIEVENLIRDVKVLAHSGKHDLLLIDTPPMVDDTGILEGAVAVSNAVVVPCRPSALDISTMDVMAEICKQYKKPFAFLLCDVSTSSAAWAKVNAEALATLADIGPVMATRISHHVAYVRAITLGKTGPEIDAKLEKEAQALWSEVVRLAGIETPAVDEKPAKKGRRRG